MRIKLATPLIGEFPRYTDKGWFSLDNRFATPKIPSKCGYAWDKALNEETGKWYVLSF